MWLIRTSDIDIYIEIFYVCMHAWRSWIFSHTYWTIKMYSMVAIRGVEMYSWGRIATVFENHIKNRNFGEKTHFFDSRDFFLQWQWRRPILFANKVLHFYSDMQFNRNIIEAFYCANTADAIRRSICSSAIIESRCQRVRLFLILLFRLSILNGSLSY